MLVWRHAARVSARSSLVVEPRRGLRPNRRRRFPATGPFPLPCGCRLSGPSSTYHLRRRRRRPGECSPGWQSARPLHRQGTAPFRFGAAPWSTGPRQRAGADVGHSRRPAPTDEHDSGARQVPRGRRARPVGGYAHGPRRGIVGSFPMPRARRDQPDAAHGIHSDHVHTLTELSPGPGPFAPGRPERRLAVPTPPPGPRLTIAARLREPAAASTAAVELVSATVPAARSSINRCYCVCELPAGLPFLTALPRPHHIRSRPPFSPCTATTATAPR